MISMNGELYRNLEKLSDTEQFMKSKKYRDTVFSLRNYYNRMLHKPSPFSTFVTVKMGLINEKKDLQNEDKHSPRVCINILFLHILESLLLKDNNSFLADMYVSLNPTIQKSGNDLCFLNVDTSNPKYMYYKENFVRIKSNSIIENIIELTGNSNIKIKELAVNMNGSINDNIILILKLSAIGLLYKNFGTDNFRENHLASLANLCRNTEKYSSIASSLDTIRLTIDKMNDEFICVSERKEQRKQIYSKICDIFAEFSINAEELNFHEHNILYENLVEKTPDYCSELISKDDIRKLYSAEKIYRIFDNNYITKILNRNIFLSNYSENDVVPIIEFYNVVETVKNKHDLIENDKDIKIIGEMRKQFFEILAERKNNETVDISSKEIDDIFLNAPPIMRIPKSYGIYYQRNGNDIIVNNTAPGYGRHFMRYVDDMSADSIDEWLTQYKKSVKENSYGELYDIGADIGLNINKHIPCFEKNIPYPKFVSSLNDNSDLYVFYDKKYELIRIKNSEGNEIEITPIGFLFPRIAPGYYRFLSSFSNSQGAEISFWDRFYSYAENNKGFSSFARIVLDSNIVIERKTWKIPCSMLKNDSTSEKDMYIYLADTLFNKIKIPKRLFARMTTDIDGILIKNNDIESWMNEIANRKLRKPQFYDLDNYLDFRNIMNMNGDLSAVLTIQETLPDNQDIIEYLAEFYENI